MSQAKQIAGNAAWLMMATVLQKMIAFLSFFFVARWSGPVTTGAYFYAVAITSVFVTFADLGLTPVVIREYASDPVRGRRFAQAALRAKFLLIPLAVLASLGYALARGSDSSVMLSVAMACGVLSADSLSLLLYGILRGSQKLRYEAVGMFMTQAVTAVVAMASAWFLRGNVQALVFALLCGSVWNLGWSWWHVRRLDGSEVAWTRQDLLHMMRLAVPFALAGMFVKVYSYVDTLFLEAYWTKAEIGHYAVAYKLTYAFQFLPLTFVAALYPGLSAMHARGDGQALTHALHGSLRLMMLISVPLAVGLSAFSSLIPQVFGRSYESAVPILQVLSWVLIPIFWDFPLGSLLNATHRAHLKTASMGVAMVVNVIANAFLVPHYGGVGASYAAIVSFVILGLLGLYLTRKDVGIGWTMRFLAQGWGAALSLYVVLRYLVSTLPGFIALAVGVVVTVIWVGLWQLLKKDDVMMLWSWIKRKRA
jgi:O-antigen/teichoic acid export membrane protein